MKNLNGENIGQKRIQKLESLVINQEDFLQKHQKKLEEALLDIITFRNIESMKHIRYVKGYTEIIAKQYAILYPKCRMTKVKISMIVQAAPFHDIGKIFLPDILFNRKDELTKIDKEPLKKHTVEGAKLVKKIFAFRGKEYEKIISNICMYHHEKYDGSGYPKGLKKDKIPIEAQIVALADIYDVLVNSQQEKEDITKEKAYYMLMNGICGELSPKMMECLENAKEKLERYPEE